MSNYIVNLVRRGAGLAPELPVRSTARPGGSAASFSAAGLEGMFERGQPETADYLTGVTATAPQANVDGQTTSSSTGMASAQSNARPVAAPVARLDPAPARYREKPDPALAEQLTEVPEFYSGAAEVSAEEVPRGGDPFGAVRSKPGEASANGADGTPVFPRSAPGGLAAASVVAPSRRLEAGPPVDSTPEERPADSGSSGPGPQMPQVMPEASSVRALGSGLIQPSSLPVSATRDSVNRVSSGTDRVGPRGAIAPSLSFDAGPVQAAGGSESSAGAAEAIIDAGSGRGAGPLAALAEPKAWKSPEPSNGGSPRHVPLEHRLLPGLSDSTAARAETTPPGTVAATVLMEPEPRRESSPARARLQLEETAGNRVLPRPGTPLPQDKKVPSDPGQASLGVTAKPGAIAGKPDGARTPAGAESDQPAERAVPQPVSRSLNRADVADPAQPFSAIRKRVPGATEIPVIRPVMYAAMPAAVSAVPPPATVPKHAASSEGKPPATQVSIGRVEVRVAAATQAVPPSFPPRGFGEYHALRNYALGEP